MGRPVSWRIRGRKICARGVGSEAKRDESRAIPGDEESVGNDTAREPVWRKLGVLL